jgi:hypothetical protein
MDSGGCVNSTLAVNCTEMRIGNRIGLATDRRNDGAIYLPVRSHPLHRSRIPNDL